MRSLILLCVDVIILGVATGKPYGWMGSWRSLWWHCSQR
jgi:hypothetical protein